MLTSSPASKKTGPKTLNDFPIDEFHPIVLREDAGLCHPVVEKGRLNALSRPLCFFVFLRVTGCNTYRTRLDGSSYGNE